MAPPAPGGLTNPADGSDLPIRTGDIWNLVIAIFQGGEAEYSEQAKGLLQQFR